MGRSFLVRIKLDTRRADLTAADGEANLRADVRRWLLDAGFHEAIAMGEAAPGREVRGRARVA